MDTDKRASANKSGHRSSTLTSAALMRAPIWPTAAIRLYIMSWEGRRELRDWGHGADCQGKASYKMRWALLLSQVLAPLEGRSTLEKAEDRDHITYFRFDYSTARLWHLWSYQVGDWWRQRNETYSCGICIFQPASLDSVFFFLILNIPLYL